MNDGGDGAVWQLTSETEEASRPSCMWVTLLFMGNCFFFFLLYHNIRVMDRFYSYGYNVLKFYIIFKMSDLS